MFMPNLKYTMNKKIFITRNISTIAKDTLTQRGFDVTVYPKEGVPSQKKIISYLKSQAYDGMISLLTDSIDKTLFDACPTLKIVANYATGYNNINLEEAKKRGIMITNTPGVSGSSVAEHAVALTLALANNIAVADRFVRDGKYKGWMPTGFAGSDLYGKTIGLVGVGSIGSKVASIFRNGFGAKIVYHDVNPNQKMETELQAVRCNTLDQLLIQADVVSLHVPLLPTTHHLIDATKLALMKSSAFLINTSRGPVVDEAALVRALHVGTIAGAGLDVFEFEPKMSKGLAKLTNVVLTPHIASARTETRNEMARIAAQGIIDFFDGKRPTNAVI